MSKSATPRPVAANEAIASLRDVKSSTMKAALVLDLIRGKSVERALNDLTFCRKKLAPITKKLLLSAIANAENNHQLNVDNLVVARAYADKGAYMKRWMQRAKGRAAPVLKHRCHLTIVVAEKAPEAKPAAKPAAAKKTAAPKAAPKAAEAAEQTEKTEA
ncbi:MAG: 50S ribosomal protein L22 [Blastochloris viridis]|uniref:Large ribosomal subunit protein uL22 n=1 Tax=Blastochloris viridis TaxID=1079 RepID=A0A6N4R500_BLAVI|nr:MAG: 50S ribosomal protein L22 [Blastochloris viridis]